MGFKFLGNRPMRVAGLTALILSVSIGYTAAARQSENSIRYEIVARHPHDASAFTQGLYYDRGFLFESTGRFGESSLRKVDFATGATSQGVALDDRFFGEGIASVGNRIYQLTWLSGWGFVYDRKTLEQVKRVRYRGEGWGLTYDGTNLILSDGSAMLRFIDPTSFEERRSLQVHDGLGPVVRLNELEYIDGEIFANIWHTNRIIRISKQSGGVTGTLDLKDLAGEVPVTDPEAVLNGIAYDQAADRLFVTGKLWPLLFEIRLLPEAR